MAGNRSDFGFGFAMGVVAGIATATLGALAFVAATQLDWLEKWQTLAAGVMALGAAIATVLYIRKQIAQVYELSEVQRARELLAARAMLPVTLSRLCSHAEACVGALLPHYMADNDGVVQRAAFIVPSIPKDDLSDLVLCVRHGDTTLQQAVSKLLSNLQVQTSRLRDFAAAMENYHGSDVSEFIADAVEVYARASSLFDFARQETDEVSENPTLQEMQSAANNLHIWRQGFLNVHLFIEGRY